MKTKWAKPAKLSALLKKHHPSTEKGAPAEETASEDPIMVLIHAWLLWEASSEQAETAMGRLMESRVDINEIRVSLPHELAPAMGKRYPRLEERLTGIKKSLHSIYLRRHEISLNYVREKGKRDAKAEIESLDGINPFVSARVLRLSFDVHAMPADEQLSLLLHELGVIAEPVEHEVLASWLASEVKAGDAHHAIAALQSAVDAAWADGTMTKLARKRRPAKPPEPVVVPETTEEEVPSAPVDAGKKPAIKKPVTKKPATKKAATKKAVTKKAVTKKAVTKKPAAKKSAAKPVAKKAAKKAATKKPAAKKPVKKKASAKKVAKKTAKRKTSRPAPAARKRVG